MVNCCKYSQATNRHRCRIKQTRSTRQVRVQDFGWWPTSRIQGSGEPSVPRAFPHRTLAYGRCKATHSARTRLGAMANATLVAYSQTANWQSAETLYLYIARTSVLKQLRTLCSNAHPKVEHQTSGVTSYNKSGISSPAPISTRGTNFRSWWIN